MLCAPVNLFFLRRQRSFNKSRYSRNRQLARVIFYFSIYINIAIIFLVFNVFYGLNFVFGNWWGACYISGLLYLAPAALRMWKRRFLN